MKLNRVTARVASAVAASCLMFATAACGGSGDSSPEAGAKEQDLKIGFFMTGSTNAYQQAMIDSAKATAKKLGADIEVLESNFDPQKQINQMDLARQRKSYDVWVLVLNSGDQQCNAVKQAISAKIPVMLAVTQACGGLPDGALGFVGVQTADAYKTWWDYILQNNDPQDLAVLTGPPLVDITKYAQSTLKTSLKENPGFKVVSNQQTDYTTGKAYQVTQDTLRANPDLKLIASNYAGMTQGVVQAVKAAKKDGKIQIFDLLGDKEIIKQIKAGVVTATLPGLPATEARLAIESAVNGYQGKDVEKMQNPLDSLEIPGGPFITKSNVDSFTPEY